MHVLYLDESGNLETPEREHVVVGGVLISEAWMRPVRRQVESTLRRHLEAEYATAEIHAQHMLKGKGAWREIPSRIVHEIVEDLCALVADMSRESPDDFTCFAVIREPGALPGVSPIERIFEEVLLRADRRAKKQRSGIMVVADESKFERIIQPQVRAWREGVGTRFGRLTRVAEVPLFADSAQSRFLQLADLVAHATFLAYERGNANLLDLLLPGFHRSEDGIMHTMMHLTASYPACDCPPCASRQTPSQSGSTEPGPGQLRLPGIP